ncbi:unnamed protein product [Echinostoma caproni]|uniref:DUF775 domain-containing protein n=1 Tax=Echinostoma caproni TaxID=27848 RepID=A0A183A438_9TREM|nr:unnamed protein product [Echinostoma caproni]
MFGAVVAGRLAPLNDVNHITVFLTGVTPLPEQMGGGVYLGLQQQGALVWYFLGVLTNARPSAIYKVGNLRKSKSSSASLKFSNGKFRMCLWFMLVDWQPQSNPKHGLEQSRERVRYRAHPREWCFSGLFEPNESEVIGNVKSRKVFQRYSFLRFFTKCTRNCSVI